MICSFLTDILSVCGVLEENHANVKLNMQYIFMICLQLTGSMNWNTDGKNTVKHQLLGNRYFLSISSVEVIFANIKAVAHIYLNNVSNSYQYLLLIIHSKHLWI